MDTDKGWLLPQECLPDGTPEEWSDSTYRLALKSSVDYQLKELLRMTKSEKLHIAVLRAMLSLNTYFDVNERVIQRHEGQRGWDRFRLLHRQLSGLASEFYALAAACPESACGVFKAQQVNRILAQMKELLGEEMGLELPLVSEKGEQSCSDVSLLLRGWLDLCAEFAWRHYDGNPPEFLVDEASYKEQLLRERILAFCQNEPKTALEIGEMLGYRNKRSIRKYLNPLLDSGRLVRTVPDKPNSRNQQYITARMI